MPASTLSTRPETRPACRRRPATRSRRPGRSAVAPAPHPLVRGTRRALPPDGRGGARRARHPRPCPGLLPPRRRHFTQGPASLAAYRPRRHRRPDRFRTPATGPRRTRPRTPPACGRQQGATGLGHRGHGAHPARYGMSMICRSLPGALPDIGPHRVRWRTSKRPKGRRRYARRRAGANVRLPPKEFTMVRVHHCPDHQSGEDPASATPSVRGAMLGVPRCGCWPR